MADQPNITRRAAFVGAFTSTAVVALAALPAFAAATDDDALTHQIIGAYFSLPPSQRIEAGKLLRKQGLGEFADFFDAADQLEMKLLGRPKAE